MAGLASFDRELRLATADLEPDAVNAALARFARVELGKAIGQGAPPTYERFVNGRPDAIEESVVAPGPILYVFSNWSIVIDTALEELVKRSPRRSGAYIRSFVVVVGGRIAVTDFSKLRADAEVIIFNAQPYTRKIEVGAMNISVPDNHFNGARAALQRRFGGAFRFERRFVDVPAGIHPLAPYRLKSRRSRDRLSRRSGSLSYPALIINPV